MFTTVSITLNSAFLGGNWSRLSDNIDVTYVQSVDSALATHISVE
jgi:hypothetical protein